MFWTTSMWCVIFTIVKMRCLISESYQLTYSIRREKKEEVVFHVAIMGGEVSTLSNSIPIGWAKVALKDWSVVQTESPIDKPPVSKGLLY